MGARTGKQYIEGLRDSREVWLQSERVKDVTTHPAFAGALETSAGLFDLQHEAKDICLMPHPRTGESISVTHMIPRSKEDLKKRHRALERIARFSMGMLGRSADYLNVTFAGFAGTAQAWAIDGNEEGAANLVAFQDEMARKDLLLTHAIVNPIVDRGVPPLKGVNGEMALHKVGETKNGIIVRGAKILATLAPFADEIAVYPAGPLPDDAIQHSLAFSIPVATPGVKMICRDSFAEKRGNKDLPFSSRFDEQDAFVVFDNVEVPWHRLFIDGKPKNHVSALKAGWLANTMQQTSIRAHVKLHFAYDLACKMCEAMNSEDPGTNQLLGEIWTYKEFTRSALIAAEEGAHDWGNGVWFCDVLPFRALRPTLPRWIPRVLEIMSLLGSHNLLAAPTDEAFEKPELTTILEKYFQGGDNFKARDRVKLFRAAWDFVGTSLASRCELYERFYLGPSHAQYQEAHLISRYEMEGQPSFVDEILAETARLAMRR